MSEAIEWLKLYMDNNKIGNKVTDKYLEVVNALIESSIQLQQENENLRATIKNDDVAVNNLCKEIENLKQNLKDKDEKISKVIEYIKNM